MTDEMFTDADAHMLDAIITAAAVDDAKCIQLVYEYWADVDRANRTPREALYMHLGVLSGICLRRGQPREPRLFAWVGEDELGSGRVGLKQALVPAGCIPLVAIDREKITTPDLVLQLQAQANHYGKTIRLIACAEVETVATITPKGGA